MALLFFDTETSGLPKRRGRAFDYSRLENFDGARLVEICWIITDKTGIILENKSFLVKPQGFEISAEVSNIHGILHSEALSQGVPIKDILTIFQLHVEKHAVRKLIAHNIEFDINILLSEIYRDSSENLFIPFLKQITQKCTMKASKNICKIKGRYSDYKYPSLKELYEFLFKTPMEIRHRAVYDTTKCMECYLRLVFLEKENKRKLKDAKKEN